MKRTLTTTTILVGCLLCAMSVVACWPDETGSVVLTIESNGHAVVPFAATVDLGDYRFAHVWCPTGDTVTDFGRCDEGLLFEEVPNGSKVTVRAPGFRTFRTTLNPGTDDHEELVADLVPVPDFVVNDDYATGFNARDGLETFERMSVAVPGESGVQRAIKFYIDDIRGSPQVYFQNTNRHPLHYNFVRNVLGRAIPIQEYEESTYHGSDRTAMAGTVVWYEGYRVETERTGTIESPFTVEFFPSDDLTTVQALAAYDIILEAMTFLMPGGSDDRLSYMPATTARAADLFDGEPVFERTGGLWFTLQELHANITMQLMNRGVAYGRLLLLTPEQLESTVVSWKDIVLLTRLPIQAPLVGGFITEEMQTPLAHVNVAAMNRGAPNLVLIDASSDPRVKPFIYPGEGGDGSGIVRFEVTRTGFTLEWSTLAEAEAFWDEIRPDGLEVPPADTQTTGMIPFADLDFEDSALVGAKAANLAVCRGVLGDMVPDGFAVPFHYYQQFIDQAIVTTFLCYEAYADCIAEGRASGACATARDACVARDGSTLTTYIEGMLADEWFLQDSASREAALDGLRYLFGHIPVDPGFASLLDQTVTGTFGRAGVRLRSSTNAEDLQEFSGAGLYESLGANTADKRPSDRIRKVWASVWNWRAFEERSFMGLNHEDVKMGVAIHRSFPAELANGVLITRNLMDPGVDGYYVNVQVGETSVTNPEDGSLPEVFTAAPASTELLVIRSRFSSLSEYRQIMTDQEITALYLAARKLQLEFSSLYGANPYSFALDIEFKLDSPDRKLVIKQARPYSWSP